MSKVSFRLVTGAVVLVFSGLILTRFSPVVQAPVSPLQQEKNITLSIKGISMQAGVAANETEREQGLSGRTNLGANEGMLFIFPTDSEPSFWMKDMKFSLDFIWFDSAKKIVQIDSNVSPATFPQTFQPSIPIRYVLEVNAGFTSAHQIAVGDQARW